MNAAFKVGLMAMLTVITLLVGMFYIWQFNPYAYYQLSGYFPHVGGLQVGSRVELMGVKIGEIASIEAEPAKRRVKVGVNVSRGTQLPVGSTFTIATTGLVGDKTLEVLPPLNNSTVFMEPGSEFTGTPPASLDAIFKEAQNMMKSARELVEDPEMRADIKKTFGTVSRTASQMEALFKDIRTVTASFKNITFQTELFLKQINGATATTIPEIQGIVAGTRRISDNIERLSYNVNELVTDPQMLGEVRGSLNNVRVLTNKWNLLTDDLRNLTQNANEITDEVKDITGDIKEITHDPEIKGNIKTVAKNATRLTQAVLDFTNPKNPLQGEGKPEINFRAEAMGVARLSQDFQLTPGALGNFNIFGDLGIGPLPYFKAGLDEIGDGNLINLQLGTKIKESDTVMRFGLVRGKLGVGADFNLELFNQPLSLSGELYDINSPRMRIGILQDIFEDYGISLYWDNQFVKGINEFNLGFRWQPHN